MTKGTKAEIKLVENTDFAASVEVTNVLTVPVSADDQLKEEQEGLVEFMKRTCKEAVRRHRSFCTPQLLWKKTAAA